METCIFVDRLTEAMRAHGDLSQSELSRRSGVSQSQISTLLAGFKSPTVMTLSKLALAMNMEPWELLVPTSVLRMLRGSSTDVLRNLARLDRDTRKHVEMMISKLADAQSVKLQDAG